MVLVVDDNDSGRRAITLLIEREGYDAIDAGSAEAALAVMLVRLPHCVILDGHMPETDGIEFLLQIREDPRVAAVRVIIFSADPDLRDLAMASGADAFVEKGSLDFAVLWREMRRHCVEPARPWPVPEPLPSERRRIS